MTPYNHRGKIYLLQFYLHASLSSAVPKSVINVIMHLSDPSVMFFNIPEQEIAIHLSTRTGTKQVSCL